MLLSVFFAFNDSSRKCLRTNDRQPKLCTHLQLFHQASSLLFLYKLDNLVRESMNQTIKDI